jgi:hypothetical protein
MLGNSVIVDSIINEPNILRLTRCFIVLISIFLVLCVCWEGVISLQKGLSYSTKHLHLFSASGLERPRGTGGWGLTAQEV